MLNLPCRYRLTGLQSEVATADAFCLGCKNTIMSCEQPSLRLTIVHCSPYQTSIRSRLCKATVLRYSEMAYVGVANFFKVLAN